MSGSSIVHAAGLGFKIGQSTGVTSDGTQPPGIWSLPLAKSALSLAATMPVMITAPRPAVGSFAARRLSVPVMDAPPTVPDAACASAPSVVPMVPETRTAPAKPAASPLSLAAAVAVIRTAPLAVAVSPLSVLAHCPETAAAPDPARVSLSSVESIEPVLTPSGRRICCPPPDRNPSRTGLARTTGPPKRREPCTLLFPGYIAAECSNRRAGSVNHDHAHSRADRDNQRTVRKE